MYKLSVVVTTNNSEKYLIDFFNSIINQSIGFENIEIIFIDSNSSDNTQLILNNFSEDYLNVSYFNVDSSYTGNLNNFGMNHITSNYVVFLKPELIILKDSLEILYDLISSKKIQMVSGNYMEFFKNQYYPKIWENDNLKNGYIVINDIHDNLDILNLESSLFTKIFDVSFLKDHDIHFEENILFSELIFITKLLFEADSLLFVNKPLLKSFCKNNLSNTFDWKNIIQILTTIELYYNYLEEKIDQPYLFISEKLEKWADLLFSKNISRSILLKIFVKSNRFLKKCIVEGMIINYRKMLLLNLIKDKHYSLALDLIDLNNSNKNFDINILENTILLLFYGFDEHIGGLAKAVINKANLFSRKKLNVILLNMDPYATNINPFEINFMGDDYKNIDFIEKNYRKLGFIEENVGFINIIDYFKTKNTLNFQYNKRNTLKKSPILINDEYIIQYYEFNHFDVFDYYKKNIFDENEIQILKTFFKDPLSNQIQNTKISNLFNKPLFKSEHFYEDILIFETKYNKSSIEEELFYTMDGYNFLKISCDKKVGYTLNNRKYKSEIFFKTIQEFCNYFIENVCLSLEKKPFLINECSGPIPSFESISPNLAYKIGNLHTNPYITRPYSFGSKLNPVSILENPKELDALVTLTNSEKNDLIKEFEIQKIYSCPNLINLDVFEFQTNHCFKKNLNEFGIFARIAPEKNISDAICAFSKVVKKNPNVILNIYGRILKKREIDEYQRLQKLINELGLENNVFFKGHVINPHKIMASSLATLFVSDREGMGLVVIESMINRTPVISYKINYGPNDIINNKEDGILVEQYDVDELANQIIYLMENPEMAIKMGINAQKNIMKNFSHDIIYEKWKKIFLETYINSEITQIETAYNFSINELNNKYYESEIKSTKQIIKEQSNKRDILINKEKLIKSEMKDKVYNMKTTNDYLKLKSNYKKRLLLFLPYIYILFKHENIITNIRLYRLLQKSDWFDIGYYLNSNSDISRDKWCKILTPELHYTCHGFDEKRKPYPHCKNYLNKKDVIKNLRDKNV